MFGKKIVQALKNKVSWSWETRNDSFPCDFPMFILKPYACKKVEVSATFLAAFADFLVLINYFQLDFQFNFVFIVPIS